MATQSVRVEFACDNETLKFTHKVPAKLVDNVSPDAIQRDPTYMSTFVATIKPIVNQHYRAAFEASQPLCCICNAPKTQVVITPSSWLHIASDPFVHVMAMAACSKPDCDTKIRQNVQVLMSEMNEVEPTQANSSAGSASIAPEKISEIMPCRVCKTIENTFRCGRCKTAFYCGKEHQTMDWPIHKQACKKKAEGGNSR